MVKRGPGLESANGEAVKKEKYTDNFQDNLNHLFSFYVILASLSTEIHGILMENKSKDLTKEDPL